MTFEELAQLEPRLNHGFGYSEENMKLQTNLLQTSKPLCVSAWWSDTIWEDMTVWSKEAVLRYWAVLVEEAMFRGLHYRRNLN